MKRLMYKLLIICMIIVTFFTYLTQNISYATTSGSSATVEAKENMEKAPEVGDLNVEKNPMMQPKDKVNIGRSEREDQIKNSEASLKEGSKQRGSGLDIAGLALSTITLFLLAFFLSSLFFLTYFSQTHESKICCASGLANLSSS